MKQKLKQYAVYLLWYSLLFAVVSAGVFIWFLVHHKSFCWTTDAISQYLPKASYFISQMKEILHSILAGDFTLQMYDFNIGMGDAVTLHTEPVYFLYLLFDESQVELAYGGLILLRFYLAGLSISIFMHYFSYTGWQCLMGSMVYIFSGYGMFAGLRHSHFIIPMIMLPLLLLSMEQIYRKKRWYLCTIFVAVSLWCGYYFTYMNTFFMGIYFLLRFFFGDEKRGIKEFLLRMRTIICSYLLGLGIANITFFNTFADYLTSSRTGSTVEQTESLLHYSSEWGLKVFKSFLSAAMTPGKWLWLGFIPLAYLCVILLFARKGNRELKISFLLGALFCLVPLFGYVFGGFSNVNNRWCYAYAFVIALITAKMADQLRETTWKELLAMGVLILPYLYVGIGVYLLGEEHQRSVICVGLLLFATYLMVGVFHFWKGMVDQSKYILLTLNVVILLWAGGTERYSVFFGEMVGQFTSTGNGLNQATDTPLKVMDEITDDTFYRSYSRESESNVQGASMILGYNGVVYYSSTLSKPMIDFYRILGLSSWSLVRVRGFDARGYLDTLASVKYQVIGAKEYAVPYGYEHVKEVLRNDVYYQIYENENALPLGYCYDKVISLDELQKVGTVSRQEVMLQAAVVDEINPQDEAMAVDSSDVVQKESETESEAVHPKAQAASSIIKAANLTQTVSNTAVQTAASSKTETDLITVSSHKIEVTDIQYDGDILYEDGVLKVNQANASLTLYFEGEAGAETYLVFDSLRMNNSAKLWFHITSSEDSYDNSYCYHGDQNTYTTSQDDYIFNLGYSEDGMTSCTVRFTKSCTLQMDELAIYCQPMEDLDSLVEERKADALEEVQIGTNTVSGTVEASKDELLVLSIPYQNGWTAYVDGEEVTIRQANIMYMGLDLTEGSHTIELRFEMPGIRISILISLVSTGVFVTALIIRKIKSVKRKKNAA